MISLAGQIERITGLRDSDLGQWEIGFRDAMLEKYEESGKKTYWVTERQAAIIERLYLKHFAD